MRRPVLWSLLFVAVTLAGCGSLTGSDGQNAGDTTMTPAPVPATEPTQPPSTAGPGVTAGRELNHTELVRRHAATIADASHTYRERVRRQYPDGTVWREYTTFVQRNGSTVRYRYNWSGPSDGGGQSIDRWSVGDETYTRRANGTNTTVSAANMANGPRTIDTDGGYVSGLGRTLQSLDVRVTGTVNRDGRTRYRLETPEPKRLPPSRNVTFVGYVTADGVFTEYRITHQFVRRDVRITTVVTVSFDDIGSTVVSTPSWAHRVAGNTTAG